MRKGAVVGFRAHSGWTTLVAVSLERKEPVVLHRDRVHLVKTFDFKFRQPYHTAEKLPGNQARDFVSQMAAEACQLALHALCDVEEILVKSGHRLSGSALILASGKTLPPFEKILASHALIHTADGELFREALCQGSAQRKLPVFLQKEKELIARAVEDLSITESVLMAKVTNLGKPLGSPWSKDEKFATLVAWLALTQNQTH
jgi:hypothetical protein